MKIVEQNKIYSMSEEELDNLWNYCEILLQTWKGNDRVLEHSECFLVGYCILLFNQMRLKGLNPNPRMMRNALLDRLPEEEVKRIMIIGKDISKRGIPIYKKFELE